MDDDFLADVASAVASSLMPGIEYLELPEITGREATRYAFGKPTWPAVSHLTFKPTAACQFLEWVDLRGGVVVHANVAGRWLPVEMELHSHGIGSVDGRVYEGFTAMFRTADGRYVGRLGFGRYLTEQ